MKFERTCIACRQHFDQNQMLRIAKHKDLVELDPSNKLEGRGAYICKNPNCINTTIKKKLLNRAFKSNLDSKIYEELGEYEQNN